MLDFEKYGFKLHEDPLDNYTITGHRKRRVYLIKVFCTISFNRVYVYCGIRDFIFVNDTIEHNNDEFDFIMFRTVSLFLLKILNLAHNSQIPSSISLLL